MTNFTEASSNKKSLPYNLTWLDLIRPLLPSTLLCLIWQVPSQFYLAFPCYLPNNIITNYTQRKNNNNKINKQQLSVLRHHYSIISKTTLIFRATKWASDLYFDGFVLPPRFRSCTLFTYQILDRSIRSIRRLLSSFILIRFLVQIKFYVKQSRCDERGSDAKPYGQVLKVGPASQQVAKTDRSRRWVGQPFRAFWLQFFPFCGFACGFDITGIPLLNYIN